MDALIEYEQPALFSTEEVDLVSVDKLSAAKRYTAASLERNRAKRDAILGALAEGHGLLRIARAFGVSHHLVSALRDSRPDLVAIEKEQLSRTIGRVLRVCIERFEDGVLDGKVHPGQLPVAFGILSDKKALLDGDPTARVESVVKHEVSLELVAGYLKKRGIELPVIDVESGDEWPVSSQISVGSLANGTPDSTSCSGGAGVLAAAPAVVRVKDGGGGGVAGARRDLPMGSPPNILETKDQ